jgi:hypothetical protein
LLVEEKAVNPLPPIFHPSAIHPFDPSMRGALRRNACIHLTYRHLLPGLVNVYLLKTNDAYKMIDSGFPNVQTSSVRNRAVRLLTTVAFAATMTVTATAQDPVSVTTNGVAGALALIRNNHPAAILLDRTADPAVQHVATSFAGDLRQVSGNTPTILIDPHQARGPLVILATLHQSPILDTLISTRKISAADLTSDLENQWEAYRQIVIENPFPNVPRALLILGSDRRGVVFGTYDISGKIGVSPWHWFADVPVAHQSNVFLTPGSRRDEPTVRYRGFFINDENPSFNTWAHDHFGGINSKMYEHVFELLLRLKGNFLWPAMWAPKAFAVDDPQNLILADAMGIVMGTSHHEPMTRAEHEWHLNTSSGITGGPWDYTTNAANLRTFWRGGIERMTSACAAHQPNHPCDSVVTIGMRGDGDEPISEGTATGLLDTIVDAQRSIIADVTHKPASATPQVWALYKEVQDYYDHGMKVPDDVTLLFSDDNWGQLRRLPDPGPTRSGGYGIYYHFDYVGTPRNYKWINTNQIEKTWQQMDLAYLSGVRQLWIVNVGDIKPMEFPLSFFMQQAWNPEAMTIEAMTRFPEDWARQIFGPTQAPAIAHLLTRYSQLAARRKPELIDATSFPLGESTDGKLNGGEFGEIIAEWQTLEAQLLAVKSTLPPDQLDAFFQLVEQPILALSNLYHLYYDVAWNHRLAASHDPRANTFADQAEAAFRRDQQITHEYHTLNRGKWNGMMLQTHIGYTGWQEPPKQIMPEVDRVASPGTLTGIFDNAPAKANNHDLISIEAPHYTIAAKGKGLTWATIPNLGRTLGSVTTFPQGQPLTTPQDNIHLDYSFTLHHPGDLTVFLILIPTLDTTGKGTQHLGLSLDNTPIQTLTVSLTPAPDRTLTQSQRDWNKAVEDNAVTLAATFPNIPPGPHTLKVFRLDDNVLLQKLILTNGPIPPTYLGPPETK